jgi:hypothetical protein
MIKQTKCLQNKNLDPETPITLNRKAIGPPVG